MRTPASGLSFWKRLRISPSAPMFSSAISMFSRPCPARPKSFTS